MKLLQWHEILNPAEYHTISGNIKIIPAFPIPNSNRKRRIWIYLPPDYELTTHSYPVLYMHDGQNLFDTQTSYSGEWQIDETLEKLYFSKNFSGAIVVGIDNAGKRRFNEYIPGIDGEQYLEFLVHSVKPFIDSHFRTLPDRENTGVAGSSLGGLISLYAAIKYPWIFSKVGAFSPAMAFAGNSFDQSPSDNEILDTKIYLDCGTRENHSAWLSHKYLTNVLDTYYMLLNMGLPENNMMLTIDQGALHSEQDWARRFPEAFMWLFKG